MQLVNMNAQQQLASKDEMIRGIQGIITESYCTLAQCYHKYYEYALTHMNI